MPRRKKVEEEEEEEEVYHVGKASAVYELLRRYKRLPEVITKARVSEESEWVSGSCQPCPPMLIQLIIQEYRVKVTSTVR